MIIQFKMKISNYYKYHMKFHVASYESLEIPYSYPSAYKKGKVYDK